MEIQLITIIMSSTVISALISATLTFIQNRKNSNLQHITLERKEWREQLRSISEEIWIADIENIDKILVKLKVRINAYGFLEADNVFQDAHLWHIIKTTKVSTEISPKVFEKCKDLLIDSVSLLLKYDWDRTKWEVRGNVFSILEKISLFLFVSVFEGFMFLRLGFNRIESVLASLILLVLLSNLYIKMYDVKKDFYVKDIEVKTNKIIKESKKMDWFLGVVVVYLYAFDKSLDTSFYAFISTFSGICNYLVIIYAPYYLWRSTWQEVFDTETKNRELYFKASSKLIARLSEILNSPELK